MAGKTRAGKHPFGLDRPHDQEDLRSLGSIQGPQESNMSESHEEEPLLGKTDLNRSIQGNRLVEPAKSSFIGSVFLVINASVGAGLLAFPYAYQLAGGVVGATLMQLVFVAFIILALLILSYCAEHNSASNYQDVVFRSCGSRARLVCEICVIVYTYGACITYFVVIADQLDSLLEAVVGDLSQHWYLDRRFTTSMVAIIILALCLFRNISYLGLPSSLGVIAMVYLVVMIVVRYATDTYPETAKSFSTKLEHSWSLTFGAIPVICFGFQCHVSSVPVYHSMKNRSVGRFFWVVVLAMSFDVTLYTLTGAFGLLSFGDGTCSDILQNYKPKDYYMVVSRVALAFNIVTSYPILHYCGRVALNDLYLRLAALPPSSPDVPVELFAEKRRRILQTSIWFISSLLIAINVSSIDKVIEPFGGLAAAFIFIFPGLCLMFTALQLENLTTMRRRISLVIAVTFIVIGTFIFFENTTLVIMHDSGAIKKVDQCVRP